MVRTFYAFLCHEFKRMLTMRNLFVLAGFVVLSLYLVQTGIHQYKEIEKNKKEFIESEAAKARTFQNIEQYGGYGFGLYFMPSPLCIFFHNSSLFTELAGNVDVGEKMRITHSLRGRQLFAPKTARLLDFSGVNLILGSLLSLLFGFEVFNKKEYLKYLSGFSSHRRIFFCSLLARGVLIIAFLLINFSLSVLWAVCQKVPFDRLDWLHLLVFLFLIIFVNIIFYLIGVSVSNLNKELKVKVIWLLALWFAIVLFIPFALQEIVSFRASSFPSEYTMEHEKLKKLMEYEAWGNKRLAEIQSDKNLNETKKNANLKDFILDYMQQYKKTYEEIARVDIEMNKRVRGVKDFSQFWAAFIPSAFSLDVAYEISSRGYGGVIKYFEYAGRKKKEFVEHYIKNRFNQKMTPFDTKDKNVFYAASRLPRFFLLGTIVLIFWFLVALETAYRSYWRSFFSIKQEKDEAAGLHEMEIELKNGTSNGILATRKIFMSNHMFNTLSADNRQFKGKLIYKERDLITSSTPEKFFYICKPDRIPEDIRVSILLNLIRRLLNLTDDDMAEVLKNAGLTGNDREFISRLKEKEMGYLLVEAALLSKAPIFMMHDITKGMPAEFNVYLKGQISKLKGEGAAILYITADIFVARKLCDYIYYLKEDAAIASINF